MSEQTHQPDQAAPDDTTHDGPVAPLLDRDDTTPISAPNGETTIGPSSDEEGEATTPMQVPAATTIQVPAVAEADVAPQPTQPATPAAPNPCVSIEDLAALQIASEPQVSPDGLLIVYVLLTSDLAANTTHSSIWLVPAVTGASGKMQPPRQLSAAGLNAFTPRWSPDGRWLAFLSDRAGSPQIYLLPLNGGEARQVSSCRQAVTDFCWRPDSRALLAVSPWKIEDDQPVEQAEELVQVWTRLDETWDGVGYKHGRHQQLWLLDLESGQQPTRLTAEAIDHLKPCWSPDGKEVAFCANRRTAPDLSASAALWVLTLETGRMRRLTPGDGLAQQPAWSPDGRWLAFYYAANQSETANVVPWIVEASGKSAPRPATTASLKQTSIEALVDNLHLYEVSHPCWYPDNTSLMVTVQARGQVHINRLYINTDHEEPLTTGNGCYLNPHMSTNGRTISALRTDWFTPGDIWAMAGNGVNRRRLTGVNDTLLRQRQLIRPRKISWRSLDNLEIEGWLYLPPLPPGARAPLVLDVHGGPTLAWAESYVHDFQVLAGMGYAVLAANPRGSAGYGEEFCRKIIDDWGGNDFRDLMLGLDQVIASEPIDGERLGITGASYGGYMTCWAITQTGRFKAAVARNSVTSLLTSSHLSDQWLWFDMIMGTRDADQDPETLRRSCSPLTFADAISTPLLLIHSTEDRRCPPGESIQLFNILRARQHPVELALYPGVSHLLDFPGCGSPAQRLDRLRRSFAWIKRYV
ncbi:MAG TPA: prolyl oligopeptidase family serine peptidase [Ktedonobacteraceae bacterium]|jgi:dipeptidyl aminopeptidase/acylaminoacyl peptidase